MGSQEGFQAWSSHGHASTFSSEVQLQMLAKVLIFNMGTGDHIEVPVDAWAVGGPFQFSLLSDLELSLASQRYGLSRSQLQALESLAVDEGLSTPMMVVARIFHLVATAWIDLVRRAAASGHEVLTLYPVKPRAAESPGRYPREPSRALPTGKELHKVNFTDH